MKCVLLVLTLLVVTACGVKGDPVAPTPAELAKAKATPTPEPTPALRKHYFPEYDQRNDSDDN
jgi:hypothetical protein